MHAAIKAKLEEFIAVADDIYDLYSSCIGNESLHRMTYDLVFSSQYRGRIFQLEPDFDWYDPDCDYIDDIGAFARAVKSKADEYRQMLADND